MSQSDATLRIPRFRPFPRLAKSIVALADQAMVSGTGFVVVLAVARHATAAEFGWFSLLWALRLFVTNLQLALVLQPLGVLAPELSGSALASYLAGLERWHRLAFITAAMAVVGVCMIPGAMMLIGLVIAATATKIGADLHRRIAYVRGDGSGAVVIDAAGNLPVALIAVAGVCGLMPTTAAVMLGASAASCAVGWLVGVLRNQPAMDAIPERAGALARRHGSIGGWLLGGTLASWGANQLYPFLVAGGLGMEAVGALSAARSLLGVTQPVLQGMDAFGGPRVRTAYLRQGGEGVRRELSHLSLLVVIAVVPICVIALVAPAQVMHLVFGGSYDGAGGAASALRWLAVQQLVIAAGYLLNLGLLAVKDPRCGLFARIAACVATILLGPLAISIWGLDGACAAMLVNSVAIVAISAAWLHHRLRARQPDPSTAILLESP